MNIPQLVTAAALTSLLLSACSDPTVSMEPSGTTDLAAAMGVADASPVGITVAPDTGDRYVLDEWHGLFRLTDDGAELVLALPDFPEADVWPTSNWTDIVALGDDRFALTAVSDGYILDVSASTLMQHFCYEPGWEEWETSYELTTSLGFDVESNSIIAQPQTIASTDSGESAVGAAVGVYDANLGGAAPEQWYSLPDANFIARGMAVENSESILLVEEDGGIHRFTMDESGPERLGTLQQVSQIGGATLDGDTLLVVDAGSDQVLEYPID